MKDIPNQNSTASRCVPQQLFDPALASGGMDRSLLTSVQPFKVQLLKWIGNKQRFAHEIASNFPAGLGTYFEPFLGSGGVLATLAPERAVATDSFAPLIDIWKTLQAQPETLKLWYTERWTRMMSKDKVTAYEEIKASYNANPNGADLLFLARSCYGGVVRFRQRDGFMSTPCGAHAPMPPAAFASRVDMWARRTAGARFDRMEYREALALAQAGDVAYCDPPYSDTQSILYGAQSFSLVDLFEAIAEAKDRGVFVALSIDGTKGSGKRVCNVEMPSGLFEREVEVDCGRSMLKRFQMGGSTLEHEVVADRLLLTA